MTLSRCYKGSLCQLSYTAYHCSTRFSCGYYICIYVSILVSLPYTCHHLHIKCQDFHCCGCSRYCQGDSRQPARSVTPSTAHCLSSWYVCFSGCFGITASSASWWPSKGSPFSFWVSYGTLWIALWRCWFRCPALRLQLTGHLCPRIFPFALF